MSDNTFIFMCILLSVACSGEPDLIDGLIAFLMK